MRRPVKCNLYTKFSNNNYGNLLFQPGLIVVITYRVEHTAYRGYQNLDIQIEHLKNKRNYIFSILTSDV